MLYSKSQLILSRALKIMPIIFALIALRDLVVAEIIMV